MNITKISRRSVFRNLAAIAASNTLLQILGFVYRIFLSRMTGAEGLGIYQLVMPFYSVLSSLTLTGFTVAVARISAERCALSDFHGARRAVSLSRLCFIVAVIILAFPVLANRHAVARGILGDIRTVHALPFVFVCLFFTGLENILKNYFYGVGRVAPQITSELSEQIIRAIAVAALLLAFRPGDPGFSAMLIVIGMVISEIFSSFMLTAFYRPERKLLSAKKLRAPSIREVLSIAVPVSAAATVNNILGSVNSILIPQRLRVSGLSAKAATEVFGVMFGMTMPLLSFPIAFIASLTSVMVPKISEQLASGSEAEMRRKAGKTIHSTSLLAMPCIAVLIPLGEPLCRLLFSHESAGAFMLPLCIATMLSYYELCVCALLNGIGMQRHAAIYIVVGGAIQLAFTWSVGIPHIGMWGFVLGYIISSGVTAFLTFRCLVKRLKLRPRWGNWFLTPLIASVLCSLICDIVYNMLLLRISSEGVCIIISALVGFCAYSLSLAALGTSITRYIKTLIPKQTDA
ncbi:MAG: oligosaccharide flippase family protein [Oscillospiraceae bacterium]|nr:oligosaccharide flippase family protein [Oscillospiraceae bacterium]